ncbi:biotin-protein ligase [Plectosphaerella plurivora]|uniref:Biotin-protein ligase n=1 Tax=Plectosphaerella plurivora TaxID=936078 RepID=A0A9P8VFX5_9PEZI|nr:biotin-protein ligase [Plectosphaerella plurivora]
MSSRKLNVLVYTGTGTTAESVRHALTTLRRLLTPNYAVTPINETVLLKEPWPQTCALLVFPGGGDLGYCRVLNGDGNRRISDFVRRGGAYLGLCAGGYYGAARCEFEVGSEDRGMEVIGRRELAFFPGTCRGGAFKGFQYSSENGARAVGLAVHRSAFAEGAGAPEKATSYYNGGGVFVDAASFASKGVEVLASYEDKIDVDGGDGNAAAVYCKVSEGAAILLGPHPEFAAANIRRQPDNPRYDQLVDTLLEHDAARSAFLKACLRKLGLEVDDDDTDIPSLSCLHISSLNHTEAEELIHSFDDILTVEEDGREYLRDQVGTFLIERDSRWSLKGMQEALPGEGDAAKGKLSADGLFIDYSGAITDIVPHETAWPDDKATPDFQHSFYYHCLRAYHRIESEASSWGTVLAYGEVVTSTNTTMDKNPKLLAKLPTGFTLTATRQVAARGRGSNVWVCPTGSLVFSTVINHPAHLAASRPVVFLQYLGAIAVAEAVKSYDIGYEEVPVKLKWPNDIYALDPDSPPSKPAYVKIGGILSTCSYTAGSYQCVVGIGINTFNARPTTSLNALLPAARAGGSHRGLEPFRLEKLLARILSRFEAIHAQFMREGFSRDIEVRYYRHWLHSGQSVTLEGEGGARARITGITTDWGMLKAVEVDAITGRETGKTWALQSDENSFDFFKGLVKRKL